MEAVCESLNKELTSTTADLSSVITLLGNLKENEHLNAVKEKYLELYEKQLHRHIKSAFAGSTGRVLAYCLQCGRPETNEHEQEQVDYDALLLNLILNKTGPFETMKEDEVYRHLAELIVSSTEDHFISVCLSYKTQFGRGPHRDIRVMDAEKDPYSVFKGVLLPVLPSEDLVPSLVHETAVNNLYDLMEAETDPAKVLEFLKAQPRQDLQGIVDLYSDAFDENLQDAVKRKVGNSWGLMRVFATLLGTQKNILSALGKKQAEDSDSATNATNATNDDECAKQDAEALYEAMNGSQYATDGEFDKQVLVDIIASGDSDYLAAVTRHYNSLYAPRTIWSDLRADLATDPTFLTSLLLMLPPETDDGAGVGGTSPVAQVGDSADDSATRVDDLTTPADYSVQAEPVEAVDSTDASQTGDSGSVDAAQAIGSARTVDDSQVETHVSQADDSVVADAGSARASARASEDEAESPQDVAVDAGREAAPAVSTSQDDATASQTQVDEQEEAIAQAQAQAQAAEQEEAIAQAIAQEKETQAQAQAEAESLAAAQEEEAQAQSQAEAQEGGAQAQSGDTAEEPPQTDAQVVTETEAEAQRASSAMAEANALAEAKAAELAAAVAAAKAEAEAAEEARVKAQAEAEEIARAKAETEKAIALARAQHEEKLRAAEERLRQQEAVQAALEKELASLKADFERREALAQQEAEAQRRRREEELLRTFEEEKSSFEQRRREQEKKVMEEEQRLAQEKERIRREEEAMQRALHLEVARRREMEQEMELEKHRQLQKKLEQDVVESAKVELSRELAHETMRTHQTVVAAEKAERAAAAAGLAALKAEAAAKAMTDAAIRAESLLSESQKLDEEERLARRKLRLETRRIKRQQQNKAAVVIQRYARGMLVRKAGREGRLGYAAQQRRTMKRSKSPAYKRPQYTPESPLLPFVPLPGQTSHAQAGPARQGPHLKLPPANGAKGEKKPFNLYNTQLLPRTPEMTDPYEEYIKRQSLNKPVSLGKGDREPVGYKAAMRQVLVSQNCSFLTLAPKRRAPSASPSASPVPKAIASKNYGTVDDYLSSIARGKDERRRRRGGQKRDSTVSATSSMSHTYPSHHHGSMYNGRSPLIHTHLFTSGSDVRRKPTAMTATQTSRRNTASGGTASKHFVPEPLPEDYSPDMALYGGAEGGGSAGGGGDMMMYDD